MRRFGGGTGVLGCGSDDGCRPDCGGCAVLDDREGGDGVVVAALGAVDDGFSGRKALGGGLGEVVLATVDSWARQGRRNVGGRTKD